MRDAKRITERENRISADFDLADDGRKIGIFQDVDLQMFDGFDEYHGIDELGARVDRIADAMADANRVVLSGSGTSGRTAVITRRAATFSSGSGDLAKYYAHINGGINAFIKSPPAIEDNYEAGRAFVKSTIQGGDYFVCISAGLTAPYIAGQLEALCQSGESRGFCAVGFNPADMARDTKITEGEKSFRQVLRSCAGVAGFSLLNPVLGPELIAGSVRMKSASMTYAFLSYFLLDDAQRDFGRYLAGLREAVVRFYERYGGDLETVCGFLGPKTRMRVFARTRHSLYCVADAAECPPTFGATDEDVVCHADLRAFAVENLLPGTAATEIVEQLRKRVDLARAAAGDPEGEYCHLEVSDVPGFSAAVRIEIADARARHSFILEGCGEGDGTTLLGLRLKLFMNILSTVMFAKKGKIRGNLMVDLKISNTKLLDRAIGLVAKIAAVDRDQARTLVLMSGYGVDNPQAELLRRTDLEHVGALVGVDSVVGTALVKADNPGITVAECRRTIQETGRLR